MNNYKIIIPIENEEEELQLRKIAESQKGIEVLSGQTRNIDGETIVAIIGHAKDIIEFAAAFLSIYNFWVNRRVQVADCNGVIRQNIKLKDIVEFLKKILNR